LRFLALTIIPYLPGRQAVYLIEEPENGVYPPAIESIFDSLRSVYHGQVLIATHSPEILTAAKASDVLCFSRTESGAVDIVRGDEHPVLIHWRGETSLGSLFAGGVLE
jgi:predicted ATPase